MLRTLTAIVGRCCGFSGSRCSGAGSDSALLVCVPGCRTTEPSGGLLLLSKTWSLRMAPFVDSQIVHKQQYNFQFWDSPWQFAKCRYCSMFSSCHCKLSTVLLLVSLFLLGVFSPPGWVQHWTSEGTGREMLCQRRRSTNCRPTKQEHPILSVWQHVVACF